MGDQQQPLLHGDTFFLDNFALRQVVAQLHAHCPTVCSTVQSGQGSSSSSSALCNLHSALPRPKGLTITLCCDTAFSLHMPDAVMQWDDPNYSGTRISFDKATFVSRVHEFFKAEGSRLVRGPAAG